MSLASELNRAMVARGLSNRAVAEAVGRSRDFISQMRNGRVYPSHEVAVSLAELLFCPALVELSRSHHTRACAVCGAAFQVNHSTRKHCSISCTNVSANRQRRIRDGRASAKRVAARKLRRDLLENRLEKHREAVAAFCRGCEPEGLCRDAGCALRPCSPLPLARQRAA